MDLLQLIERLKKYVIARQETKNPSATRKIQQNNANKFQNTLHTTQCTPHIFNVCGLHPITLSILVKVEIHKINYLKATNNNKE